MRETPLPSSHLGARSGFLAAAERSGVAVVSHPVSARGPSGEELFIDVAHLGAQRPAAALLVLSGVHGVEGFVNSALETDLLDRLDPASLPGDVAVVLVHAVNPWGMAWSRRQNESNVDLNRNWRRDLIDPVHNDAYDVVHPLACPDTPTLPSVDDLLVAAAEMIDRHGIDWVRDAITRGQYRHPDGLHYGGDRTEEPCRILEEVAADHLGGVERLFTLDLHTGHGAPGELVLLCDQPPGSDQHRFLVELAGADRVEATIGDPAATTGLKSGQIANGLGDHLDASVAYATSSEFGTVSDEEQLVATYLESWVHRHGDRDDPDHDEVVRRYRRCFTPEDPQWAESCLAAGRELLDSAVAAVAGWSGRG